jgi:uroporphyrinogen decarboxylase
LDYQTTLATFERLVREKPRDRTMAALIIDSPWLPGYAGADTLDFFFDPAVWLTAHERAAADLPGVAFVPGTWMEYGMAAEPSGWGIPIRWSRTSPPAIRPHPGGLAALAAAEVPDPEIDGLMPAVLSHYERMTPILANRGMSPRMAAARGPLAVASHLTGVTELLMATQLEPEACLTLLEKTTELCIGWLQCQLERMEDPIGVMVLDDIVGMIGPEDAKKFALPLLRRIFESFPGMIHIYHNDTPNEKMLEGLATIGMDVFNFSHEIGLERARTALGDEVVLMGNLPPLDLLVRGTPEQVRAATGELIAGAARLGPLLVSPGGGVSPGTPIENLKAMLEVVQDSGGSS